MSDSQGDIFLTTRWSLIAEVRRGESREAEVALESLFHHYYRPVYIHVRRRGFSPEDSEDLVQAFFLKVFEKNLFSRARREKGRLRAFLLTDLKLFLRNEWQKDQAEKRGGQYAHLRLGDTAAHAERELQIADPDDSPDVAFEKSWASSLLASVMTDLGTAYAREGKGDVFELLKDFIPRGRFDVSYPELAAKSGQTENALRTAATRLRQRYRRLLEEHIRDTVSSDEEVEDEIQYLLRLFQNTPQ